jgi:Trk-type K+ transport system membrane component
MYWGSAHFYGPGLADAIPIMTYHENGEAGMLVCTYGSGTVFLSSPHPEYEEGDERDGTSFEDELNDPDSEWGLLLKVSIWLVETAEPATTTTTSTTSTATTTTTATTTSTSTTTTTTMTPQNPMIIVSLVGGIGIVAIVLVLIRRR